MTAMQRVDEFYALAKQGEWAAVLAAWRLDPAFARRCAHYAKQTSGWTFLHQAAHFGAERAVRELVGWGASAAATSLDGQDVEAVARARGHDDVADLVSRAAGVDHGPWEAPLDPEVLPSSCLWDEAQVRRATTPMTVAYGGSLVDIRDGDQYFVDSFERVLVGWHGTYCPPLGMSAEPMVDLP